MLKFGVDIEKGQMRTKTKMLDTLLYFALNT